MVKKRSRYKLFLLLPPFPGRKIRKYSLPRKTESKYRLYRDMNKAVVITPSSSSSPPSVLPFRSLPSIFRRFMPEKMICFCVDRYMYVFFGKPRGSGMSLCCVDVSSPPPVPPSQISPEMSVAKSKEKSINPSLLVRYNPNAIHPSIHPSNPKVVSKSPKHPQNSKMPPKYSK